jgi:toxin ParE1/3/4
VILVIKPAARSDILRQIGYYGDINRTDIGNRFMNAVQSSISRLLPMPLAGSPKYFGHPALEGLRTWPVKGFDDFRIYYLIQGDHLVVLRILHGRRDVEGILEDFDGNDH